MLMRRLGGVAVLAVALGCLAPQASAGSTLGAALQVPPATGGKKPLHPGVDEFHLTLVHVPDLRGYGLKGAKLSRLLEETGFTIGDVTEAFSAWPPGQISDQSPPPGSLARRASRIAVVVSRGPDPGVVSVPDVTGRPLSQASQDLASLQLGVGKVTQRASDEAAQTVLEQSPVAGSTGHRGDLVDLVVAVRSYVTVPTLTGATADEARRRLQEIELEEGRSETRPSDQPRGTIIGQAPPAGTQVLVGTSVDLAISGGLAPSPPNDCDVPELRGLDGKAAEASLKRSGLTRGAVAPRRTWSLAQGVVLLQAPAPGTQISCGAAVDLWIAAGPPVPIAGAAAAAALLLLGAVLLVRGLHQPGGSKHDRDGRHGSTPDISVHAVRDDGTQRVSGEPDGVALGLVVQRDLGRQSIRFPGRGSSAGDQEEADG